MILTFLMMWATKEQSLACSRYMQGIALLSKNDVFGDFNGQALVHFASALRMSLASYGDWDGVPEHFNQAIADALTGLWNQPDVVKEFASLMEAAESLERQQQPSRRIDLDEVMKLKACCDAYLVHRIGREVQKAIQRREASAASSTGGS